VQDNQQRSRQVGSRSARHAQRRGMDARTSRARVIVHPGHFYDFPFGPLIVVSLIQTSEAFKREPERLEALLAEK